MYPRTEPEVVGKPQSLGSGQFPLIMMGEWKNPTTLCVYSVIILFIPDSRPETWVAGDPSPDNLTYCHLKRRKGLESSSSRPRTHKIQGPYRHLKVRTSSRPRGRRMGGHQGRETN